MFRVSYFILALLAIIGGARSDRGLLRSKPSRRPPRPDGATTTSSSTTSGSVSSSVVCTSNAFAGRWADATDAWVLAVKRVVRVGCHPRYGGNKRDFAFVIGPDVAEGFAEALSDVSTKCTVNGQYAAGCASGSSWAKAWADFWASGVAIASVEAELKKHCNCGVGVKAAAEGIAAAAVKATVAARTRATARVCTDTSLEDEVEARAYYHCVSSGTLEVMVNTVAKAMVDSHCYADDAEAEAIAEIEASVDINWELEGTCEAVEFSTLSCSAPRCRTDGKGNTYEEVTELY